MFPSEYLISLFNRLKEWSKTNPKKCFFYLMIFLYFFTKFVKNKLKKPKSLKNKVAFITGGASGIGRLVALKLKKLGAIVIICDINKKGLEEMSTKVDMVKYCDVTDYSQIEKLASDIFLKYNNTLDILINNAGVVIAKRIEELTEKQIRLVYNVNILSHFWTIKSFLPKMKEKNSGHIVTIASASSYGGTPLLTDYSSSKFACRGLDQALSRELQLDGYNGIKFSCVNPYFIDTGMFDGTKSSWIPFLKPDNVANNIIKCIQYEWREIIMPLDIAVWFFFENWLSHGFKDFVTLKTCDLRNFKGH